MDTLLTAAFLPVIGLCYFIYRKDSNREPLGLLMKLLLFGALTCIPIIIVEELLGGICNTDNDLNLISIFIKIFFGVALAEEGFKWLVVKLGAYNHREFDEIYDIIVYSVFVSLGFAAIENFLYVLVGFIENGNFNVAISRAFLSIPGHASFAVFMGYYLSRAKVASINGNKALYIKNTILSILMPMLFHTMYDALLFWHGNTGNDPIVLVFLLFDITMVAICFITVNKMSKVQQNLTENLEAGSIVNNNGQIQLTETQSPNKTINYCPLCGSNVMTGHFCPKCGLRIR